MANMSRGVLALLLVAGFASARPSSLAYAQGAPYTLHQIDAGFSPAMDVSDNGQAVGWFYMAGEGFRGYTWTADGGLQPIPMPTGTTFPVYTAVNDPSQPVRINNNGVVAGQALADGVEQGAVSDGTTLTWVGSFDSPIGGSRAGGINAAGQVAGFSAGGGYNNFGPYIWSAASGMQKLTGFTGVNGTAFAINVAGAVAGSKGGLRQSTGGALAFYWSSSFGDVTIPDVAGGAYMSEAMSLNDNDVVVGRYLLLDGQTYRMFRWSLTSNVTEDLSAPTGYPELMDINNAGDIVATIIPPTGGRVPYLYHNGTWTNLNDLLPSGTTFRLQFAEAINNKGWIAGSGTTDPNGAELGLGYVIVPPNQPPVANADSISTSEDTPVTGTLTADDPENDPLTFSVVTNGTKGTVTITDASTGAYTYQPTLNVTGSDSFTFKANDGELDSNVATVTVTISPTSSCATDITASVAISMGPTKLNRKTGLYTQSLTLRNKDGAATGPVSLVFDNLSANAAVVGAAGTTACQAPTGSPYVNVDVGSDGIYSSRERTSVAVEFTNPSGLPVTYTLRVLAGSGSR